MCGDRLLENLIVILFGISGGSLVGTSAAAFITLLDIVPRLAQLTDSSAFIRFYEKLLITSTFSITLLSLLGGSINLSKILLIPIGFSFGVFVGLLASALAEVINVIPVLVRRVKITKNLYIILFAMSLGKVTGSLIYWLVLIKK